MEPKTIIELSNEDALAFVAFQKRYAFFQLLDSLDVFEIRNGSVTVNFNDMGAISTVTLNKVYRP